TAVGDGCELGCRLPRCGDGIASPGELCYPSQEVFPGASSSMAVGDIDGDSDLDVAAASGQEVRGLLNDGAGRLQSPLVFTKQGDSTTFEIAMGDLNGDGAVDLVTADGFSNTVTVLLDQGGLQFTAPILFPLGEAVVSLALADLDGDLTLDVAVGT